MTDTQISILNDRHATGTLNDRHATAHITTNMQQHTQWPIGRVDIL